MTTITLSALPGHHEHTLGDAYTTTVVEVLGERLGDEGAEIRNLADIRAAVRRFGTRVAATHPDRSFTASVGITRGCRKPNGFDAANHGNGLGQQQWMQTVTKEREPATGIKSVLP